MSDAMTGAAESQLKDLAEAANGLAMIDDVIANTQKALEEMQARRKRIAEEVIPAKMLELGMKSFTLENGKSVSVKPYYSTSIKPENRDRAFAFLRDTGHGSLIKRSMTLAFGMGEDEKATTAAKLFRAQGLDFKDEVGVHPATLKSYVKTALEEGEPLDIELFSVYVGSVAVIK
jgi:hypothetical protein